MTLIVIVGWSIRRPQPLLVHVVYLCNLQAFQTYSREEKKSWFDARDHCRALGGDLASIHAQNIDEASIKSMFQ